jgi:hypothetical protein
MQRAPLTHRPIRTTAFAPPPSKPKAANSSASPKNKCGPQVTLGEDEQIAGNDIRGWDFPLHAVSYHPSPGRAEHSKTGNCAIRPDLLHYADGGIHEQNGEGDGGNRDSRR